MSARRVWKHCLVLQFPEEFLDYDGLIELENAFIGLLREDAKVDGHDSGSGESNIFIFTDNPQRTFATAKGEIDRRGIPGLRAAFRERTGDAYTILWPPGLAVFKVT